MRHSRPGRPDNWCYCRLLAEGSFMCFCMGGTELLTSSFSLFCASDQLPASRFIRLFSCPLPLSLSLLPLSLSLLSFLAQISNPQHRALPLPRVDGVGEPSASRITCAIPSLLTQPVRIPGSYCKNMCEGIDQVP